MRHAWSPSRPGASGACETGKVRGLAGPVRPGNRGRSRRSGRVGVRGPGGQEIGGVPGGPGGSGGREIWGVNSRIVTIIFETENLFFPARETIRLFTDGIRSWGERGLRFLPMSAPAVPVPGALRRPEKRVRAVLGRRLGPARSGWFPVRSGASLLAGLYPFQPAAASGICAGRGRRPPVQALPAGPGQSPRSRELQRQWTCRQPGAGRRALPPVRNIRGSRGRRSPPCGRPLFPGPWSCRGRSCPRNGADGVDRGPFRTRARRWRCGRPGRGPSIPPPGKTATGVLPSPTPPERRWRPGPKAEVNGGNAGRRRLASQHAGRHRALRTFRPVERPSRPKGSRPQPPTVSGVMVSPEGSSGGGRGGPRRGVSASRIPKALSSPVVCHL